MKKLLLPSALILAFGLSVGIAQNINKAIQLSQDPTGAFGVDTNNNAYFPGHLLTIGPGTPVVTSCGTGTPTIAGTDTAGTIVTGTTITGCVATFAKAYLATPYCIVAGQVLLSPVSYTPATTGINFTVNSNGALTINYICSGSK